MSPMRPRTLSHLPVMLDDSGGEQSSLWDPFVADRDPIWRVENPKDYEALKELASVFGCDVVDVRGRPGKASAVLREEVVGVGDDPTVIRSARLYAHLTRRRFRKAGSLKDLFKTMTVAVVVASEEEITDTFLDRLYSGRRAIAPGIVCAATVNELHRQVLLRTAAASLVAPVPVRQLYYFPTLPLRNGTVASGGQVIESDVSVERLSSVLSHGSGVLTISGHSNGWDALLGSAVLCPVKDLITHAERPDNPPPCYVFDWCHRVDAPIKEAMQSSKLMAPSVVKTRVLIFAGCFSVLTHPSLINPRWGYSYAWAGSSTVGAVIAPWNITVDSPIDVCALSAPIAKGQRVGHALATFNRSAQSTRHGIRMCLFGDPATRLPYQRTVHPKVKTVTRRRSYSDELSNLSFLRHLLVSEREHLAERSAGLSAIEGYETRLMRGLETEGTSDAGVVMRKAVLALLAKKGHYIYSDWVSWAFDSKASERRVTCATCGQGQLSIAFKLRVPGTVDRCIVSCPCCGITGDYPGEGTGTEFTVVDRACARWFGYRPAQFWNASLVFMPASKREFRAIEWPRDEGGNPEELVDVANVCLDNAIFAVLCLIIRTTLYLFRRPLT